MNPLIWSRNAFLNESTQNALQQYIQIGQSLLQDITIQSIKTKLRNLPSSAANIRSFLAYILPSYCGKTQSVFAFGDNLLPLYFPLNCSDQCEQSIYTAFQGNVSALSTAFRRDYRVLRLRFDPTSMELINNYGGTQLYSIGLIAAMIEAGRNYRNNPEGMQWMEYLTRAQNVEINPISLKEFLNMYPLDTLMGNGLVCANLLNYVIVLDEFPSIQDDPSSRRNHDLSNMVKLAAFVRNLGKALGMSVMVMGKNTNTFNLVGRDAASTCRGEEPQPDFLAPQPDFLNFVWCTVFLESVLPSKRMMILNSDCAEFFNMNNINSFRYGAFGGGTIKPLIDFIIRQVNRSRPGIGILLLRALGNLIRNYRNDDVRSRDIDFLWKEFSLTISRQIYRTKRLFQKRGVLGNLYLMTLISPVDIPKRENTYLINSHYFYLTPPQQCIDQNPSSYFYLYLPTEDSINLQYRKETGNLCDWHPEVRSPVAESEFFIYLASWGYFKIPDQCIFGASKRPIAWALKKKIDEEFNKGRAQSREPARDWVEFENLCLAALCNASHSGGFSSTSDGTIFIKELVAHLIAYDVEVPDSDQYLHQKIEIEIPENCYFEESLSRFVIPYLGSVNNVWHEAFERSLENLMKIGNMSYLPNRDQLDMSFDIYLPEGGLKRDGGALEAKFRDGALRYSQIMKYLTGFRSENCPLVIIACAMAPKSRSRQRAYLDLIGKSARENINIYIIRHIKKPRTGTRGRGTRRFVRYEESIIPEELEVLVVGTPTNAPERVVVVVEAYFPIPRR